MAALKFLSGNSHVCVISMLIVFLIQLEMFLFLGMTSDF